MTKSKKRVLILGAGLVSRPMVRYLLELPDVETVVATRTVSKAQDLIAGHPNGKAVPLLVDNEPELHRLVADADVVVSLLPYTYHTTVARHCLDLKKHLVTTSYVGDAMRQFSEPAAKAGLLFLNEIGLDPGIDHMSAMVIIDRVRNAGGKVVSFVSSCGGLPAPDANDNPLGYKFSWSPKGVLMAGRNDARFLKDGKEVFVPSSQLFSSYWKTKVEGLGELEAYPNRNSLPYIELYGLQGIKTMLRATFRNTGWCETMQALVNLGLLKDDREWSDLKRMTYAQWLREFVPEEGDLRQDVAKKLGLSIDNPVMERLGWLGLFSDECIGLERGSSLDILAKAMLERMSYKPGERDMIVLQHQFEVAYPDKRGEFIESTLIDFGQPDGDSAMARTVSLPAAIAVKMIIDGQLHLTGVQIPVVPEIYQPVLTELENLGIKFQERVREIS
ncbi:MAG: saccharopine dehydrogenase NADP-binding domain-containing protein [candidate division WOR-3 bacterium]|jgi:saccharopine dehydrogenase-like NADP-dependent oxidoreductase|nr:saccharopine dehydrogenase NADP-binding domain-containing protein [candidate division WOR-3 bacterium]MCR4423620.1 saccharopine dehydrogenase NADP-binding domain-containing protein [candidate division WOR-3 bacterium]MDH7518959.1 saccharopine dehydrogenase C-terminal domain-containing protein [bacterium]